MKFFLTFIALIAIFTGRLSFASNAISLPERQNTAGVLFVAGDEEGDGEGEGDESGGDGEETGDSDDGESEE